MSKANLLDGQLRGTRMPRDEMKRNDETKRKFAAQTTFTLDWLLFCSMSSRTSTARDSLGTKLSSSRSAVSSRSLVSSRIGEQPPSPPTCSMYVYMYLSIRSYGIASSSLGWETWSGLVTQHEISWKKPSLVKRGGGRNAESRGETPPPPLLPGCHVIKGPDWCAEYAEPQAKKATEDRLGGSSPTASTGRSKSPRSGFFTRSPRNSSKSPRSPSPSLRSSPLSRALTSPSRKSTSSSGGRGGNGEEAKSPPETTTPASRDENSVPPPVVGVVEEIVELGGIKGGGRRVRWPDGTVNVYRWGAEGALDLTHVQIKSCGAVNGDKIGTDQIRFRYPPPELREETLAACEFGYKMSWGVVLRIRPSRRPSPFYDVDCAGPGCSGDEEGPAPFTGEMEWPDFSAVVSIEGERWGDGTMTFREVSLISGAHHCGWMQRFAQPEWVPGVSYTFAGSCTSEKVKDPFPSLLGSFSYFATVAGSLVEVSGDVRLSRSVLFTLDDRNCSKCVKISSDGSMATCIGNESRSLVYGSLGFNRGVHYWEVKVAQGEPGCVFIGVAEKPQGASRAQLERWQGWGFVNYRATYHCNNERVYGEHYHSGDTVGVQLDMEKGVLSFFLDGMKYGEHITVDLGPAVEGLLGSRVRVSPRTLFPVFGFRKSGDRICLSQKWMSSRGTHPGTLIDDACAVSSLLVAWEEARTLAKGGKEVGPVGPTLPRWFMREAWQTWNFWRSGRWYRSFTRPSAAEPVDLDMSPRACIAASIILGLREPLFSGDVVEVSCSCGRNLETKETARVLGACNGRLFYRVEGQRGDSAASEGASSAWFWVQSDIGSGIRLIKPSPTVPESIRGIPLGLVQTYRGAWLRVVYEEGAVVRLGMEIDSTTQVSSFPFGSLVKSLERRISSTGVARHLVEKEGVEGWVSEHICGGGEETIMRKATLSDLRAEIEDLSEDCVLSTLASNKHAYEEIREELERWISRARKEGGAEVTSWLEGEGWADTSPDLTFEDFLLLAGDRIWNVERDMRLVELVNDISAHCGLEPLNSSYAMLQKGLESIRKGERSAQDPFEAILHLSLKRSNEPTYGADTSSCLEGISTPSLLARLALLIAFNNRVGRALPLLTYASPEEEWQRCMLGSSGWSLVTKDDVRALPADNDKLHCASIPWKPQCTSRHLRNLRWLLFTHTKRAYWDTLIKMTVTPTPLHHDEYEDPREIRLIRMNRVKATPSRLGAIQNPSERLRHSVFGQLHREMRGWPNSAYRRAYVGKGHGGQKRAFKVKFLGEGVNDYGGPYRAVFEQVVDELQNDRLPLSGKHVGDRCLLPLLIPCPNRQGHTGGNQDKFIFAPDPIGASPVFQELAHFLGKLVGMAARHGLQMGLDLPATVWRPLVGLPVGEHQLEAIDAIAEKLLRDVTEMGRSLEAGEIQEPPEEWTSLNMTTHLSDLREVALTPAGQALDITVSKENWRNFVTLVRRKRLQESSVMLRSFRDGLATVLPVEIFPLFTPMELERLICGVPSVDVNLLKQCTEYEGVDPNAPHIKYFWEVLEEMQPQERTSFLSFVWARSRMPSSANDFPMGFKIQGASGGAQEFPDSYLPHAQTCFFSLTLPAYSSKDILRSKLLFAINNSPNMDADVRLHSAEGWADT